MRTSSVVDDRPIFSAICLPFLSLSLVHSFLHFYLARSQSLVILEQRRRVLCSHIIFLMIFFLFMHLMGIPFSPPSYSQCLYFFSRMSSMATWLNTSQFILFLLNFICVTAFAAALVIFSFRTFRTNQKTVSYHFRRR